MELLLGLFAGLGGAAFTASRLRYQLQKLWVIYVTGLPGGYVGATILMMIGGNSNEALDLASGLSQIVGGTIGGGTALALGAALCKNHRTSE